MLWAQHSGPRGQRWRVHTSECKGELGTMGWRAGKSMRKGKIVTRWGAMATGWHMLAAAAGPYEVVRWRGDSGMFKAELRRWGGLRVRKPAV